MSDHECYDWTRLTKSQLMELKAYFFADFETEMISIDTGSKHVLYSQE